MHTFLEAAFNAVSDDKTHSLVVCKFYINDTKCAHIHTAIKIEKWKVHGQMAKYVLQQMLAIYNFFGHFIMKLLYKRLSSWKKVRILLYTAGNVRKWPMADCYVHFELCTYSTYTRSSTYTVVHTQQQIN